MARTAIGAAILLSISYYILCCVSDIFADIVKFVLLSICRKSTVIIHIEPNSGKKERVVHEDIHIVKDRETNLSKDKETRKYPHI